MKRSPEHVLETIFDQIEFDKINAEVDAMSDEQIQKELEAEGYTEDKIDAAFAPQQRMLDELLAEERRQRRQQVVSYVGGVATAAAVALAVRATTTTPSVPTVTTAAKPPPSAGDLRKEAFEACGRGHWDACRTKLDEAKALDPDGESDADVQQARRTLENHTR